MNTADPLAQLRDIHMPEAVSWWPPAIGWWIVIASAILAVGLLFYFTRKYILKNRYKKIALQKLTTIHKAAGEDKSINHERLVEMSAILRRVAMQTYGRQTISVLSGQKWLAFLDRTGNTNQFSQGAAKVLGTGLYRPDLDADFDQVRLIIQKWIKEHKK